MDGTERLMSDPTPELIRETLAGWLDDNWDPDLSLVDWRRKLAAAGWAAPSWPRRWNGRDWPDWTVQAVAAGLAERGAIGITGGVASTLVAPTLLAHGDDELRDRFLAPIVSGEESWCQLFSEPGAGSDLAGLTTRAELDGDEWVVNGQKVWNTSADHADFGLLLARTDWDAPKHKGLTCLILPMRQAGVTVTPLRQINGHASFNEVFCTDARIPAGSVIGAVGAGWAVARTTLSYERGFGGIRNVPRPRPRPEGRERRALAEARREAEESFAPYAWYAQRSGRTDLLVERARSVGRADAPVVRQEIARCVAMEKAGAWTADRARVAREAGRRPGAEGSIGKLATSILARAAARTHSLIAGASGTLTGADAPMGGIITEVLVSVPAQSIAGGTDEIQRNILAETVLGLPREPSSDRDIPFRQIPRNL